MNTTPIFIPTYGRQVIRTLDSLCLSLRDRVVLVVAPPPNISSLPPARLFGLNYVVCPCQGQGVMLVRDWIVQHCKRLGIDCCIMLDDDIRLTVGRFKDGKKRFRAPIGDELIQHFNMVERLCLSRGVGFASFSQTFFNEDKETWARNRDNASTYFVNVPATALSGASFLGSYIEDRKFILETIEARLDVWCDTYVGVTKIGRHAVGGQWASGHRGPKHEESLRTLAETYPRFVRLRRSKNRAYIKNYGTNLSATFYLQRMWEAVKRGEKVRR